MHIQKPHCDSETNSGLQKNLSRVYKQLRFVKCHASIVCHVFSKA